MEIRQVEENGKKIAIVSGLEKPIGSGADALDVIMTAKYAADSGRVAIEKAAFEEKFFILSSGLAGEVLQKFINYQVKAAIFGDYSKYTSKPLKDFIYESNRGRDVFFVGTEEEAVEKLARV